MQLLSAYIYDSANHNSSNSNESTPFNDDFSECMAIR